MGVCLMGSWHKMAICGWSRVMEGKTRRRQVQTGGQRVLRPLQRLWLLLGMRWKPLEGLKRKVICHVVKDHSAWTFFVMYDEEGSAFQFCLYWIWMMVFFAMQKWDSGVFQDPRATILPLKLYNPEAQ